MCTVCRQKRIEDTLDCLDMRNRLFCIRTSSTHLENVFFIMSNQEHNYSILLSVSTAPENGLNLRESIRYVKNVNFRSLMFKRTGTVFEERNLFPSAEYELNLYSS